MTLAEWQKIPGNTFAGLAARLGVTKGYIWNLARDEARVPSMKLAARIEAETGGLVPATVWQDRAARAA